jgi:replicative DNA helicase
MTKRNTASQTKTIAPKQHQSDFRADQLAPHSIESEEAVLGSILISPDALLEVASLKPDDFFIVRHAWVYEAMLTLHNRRDPVDYLTVVNELEQARKLTEVGGAAYILSLINKTPSALNVWGYGQVVEKMALRRRLIDAGGQLARLAHSNEADIDVIIEKAEAVVGEVTKKRAATISTIKGASELANEEFLQAIMWDSDPQEIRGYRCGIEPVDRAMGGWEERKYYKVAAPTGVGKSALLCQMFAGFAENGAPGLYFSLEMPANELIRRIICQRAQVDSRKLKEGKLTPQELERYKEQAMIVAKFPLWIESRAGLSVRQMQSIARRFEREKGIKAVFVDTINRVGDVSKGSTPYQGMTNASTAVADWAHNSNFFVIDASQLSRAAATRTDKRPQLSDLRDSGSQEQDADGVFMLYREGYYNPEKLDKANIAELILRKNRYGEANYTVELFWQPVWPGFARLQKTTIDLEAGLKDFPKPKDTLTTIRERQAKREALKPTGTEG